MQWSFDLLPPAERAVLARSAVFAGGFTLEAAEHVCARDDIESADILDLLDSLVRKSLLTVDRSGEVVRYGLLETIRQFGEERLAAMGESEAARDRHARYFAADSSVHFQIWRSPRQLAAYQWLDREMDNMRVAFRWAVDRQDIDSAATIASNIGDMTRFRLREEAVHWPAEIVDSFVWAYGDAAMAAWMMGDPEQLIAWAEKGAAHPADRHDAFLAALRAYHYALAGRREEAMQVADAGIAAAEVAGIPHSIAIAQYGKGHAFAEAEPKIAIAAFQRAIEVARRSGNRFWEILATSELSALQARSGDTVTALRSARQMIGDWRGVPDTLILAHGVGGLILLFERLSRTAPAATVHAALNHVFRSVGMQSELPDAMRRARAALGDAEFEEATRRGAAMELRDATDYALAEIELALISLGEVDVASATIPHG